MKSNLLSGCFGLLFLSLWCPLRAWHTPSPQPHVSSSRTGTCTVPISQIDLDINNVRTHLLNAGDLWWDLSTGKYEVPKGSAGSPTPSPQAIFAGAIWVTALDQGSNLRGAMQTYRQNGTSDFYSGPLDNNGTVTAAICSQWDRHFNVYASEIVPLIQAYNSTGTVSSSLITSDLQNWPGQGNAYLTSQGMDMTAVLAPFFDANGDGIYNPADGDYPTLRQGGHRPAGGGNICTTSIYNSSTAYADQMIFWVLNDAGNTHTTSSCTPINLQINALAYAFQSTDAVNDMTFYTYNFINKSGGVLNRTYISQWTDVDLGCANNDRVGCDTSRNMAIAYNGSSPDAGSVCPSGEVGYGTDLPMLGIKFLEGPLDTVQAFDTLTQTRHRVERKMSSFCYFNVNGGATTGDPSSCVQFRNYQTGHWLDFTPVTYGGNGYRSSGQATTYTFSGDPAISTQWSECNPQIGSAIPYGDRRFVQSTGPFTFMPCAQEFLSIAVVFIRPPGGVGLCPSWSVIGTAADRAQTLFDNNFSGFGPNSIASIEPDALRVHPNPVSSSLFFDGAGARSVDEVLVYDLSGRIVLSQRGSIKSLDMTKLPEGLYLVKAVTVDQHASSFKILKR